MSLSFVILVVVQALAVEVAYGQCINRFLPNFPCGPNIVPVAETVLPNQVVVNPVAPNIIAPNVITEQFTFRKPCGCETIIPAQVPAAIPATTIIQDSTVANNLANALQLLVVSNLLSNTLPGGEVVAPVFPGYPAVETINGNFIAPVPSCGCGGAVNYVF